MLVFKLSKFRDGDEAEIRERWGGPVCLVETTDLTSVELQALADDVANRWDEFLPGRTAWTGAPIDGRIEIQLPVATLQGQARLDEEYGAGLVELHGRFWAID